MNIYSWSVFDHESKINKKGGKGGVGEGKGGGGEKMGKKLRKVKR